MRSRTISSLVIVFGVIVGLALPAGAGSQELPFRTSAALVSESSSMSGSVSIYEGRGTHLGEFSLTEVVTYTAFDPPWISFVVEGTYVAANGDELTYRADGQFNVMTGEKTGEGFAFTGGTGRFSSAEGHGQTSLVFDSSYKIVGLNQTGVISYNASDRSHQGYGR